MRKTPASAKGKPSSSSIRSTASERSRIVFPSTKMMEPTPASGNPAPRANVAHTCDWRAVKRNASLRSKRSRKSTQRLQKAHSPSNTTTACPLESMDLLSQPWRVRRRGSVVFCHIHAGRRHQPVLFHMTNSTRANQERRAIPCSSS
jgi:hypothetical protein